MSTLAARNTWYGFLNLFQRPFFDDLAWTARLNPFTLIQGRKHISIGPYTRVGPFCRFMAEREKARIRIGQHCQISPHVMFIAYGGWIEIGDYCSFNPFSVFYGHGGLKIGNGVRIGAGTVIIPSNHNYDDPDQPIHEQGNNAKGIVLEDDIWIGANVTVLDGVRVGHGSVLAAGAVVNKDVEPYSVVGGVPARLIRKRK